MSQVWDSKDPTEVKKYRYDWTAYLGTAIISTSIAVVDAGAVVITAQSTTGNFSDVTLSGGVNGDPGVVRITIITNGAETLEASIVIPVIDTYASAPVTAYTLPAVANLLSIFPEFSGVPSIGFWLTRSARNVDTSWTEGDYQFAIILLAAHSMALFGLGTGADAKANSGEASQYSQIRSGQLTLTRKTAADISGSNGSAITSTVYGRHYIQLMRASRPRSGVAVLEAGIVDIGGWGSGYGWQIT